MRVEAPPAPRLHPEAVQPERRRARPREKRRTRTWRTRGRSPGC